MKNCDLIQAQIVRGKKSDKILSKFNTRYSRGKKMVFKCLLCEFIISDLLKRRVIERCNKEPSTLDPTSLNNGILFGRRDTTKFLKPFHKVTGFNLPVWVSKTLAQKSELDITSTTTIRTLTAKKTKPMSDEAALDGKMFGLTFL